MPDTDEELIDRWYQCESVAFDELYKRYFGRFCRYLTALTHRPEDAEDLAQKAMMRILMSKWGLEQGGENAETRTL